MARLIAPIVAGALVLMAAAPPSRAAEEAPAQLALEGVARLLEALQLFIDSLPQYEAPYINEDGDIIIRRKRAPQIAPEDQAPAGRAAPDTARI
jgi:hypothetical protein